ncbi:cytochrome P450 family 71 polypeptide [Rhynchospora pubera]|uniref:Cytochrome P450 family 71 polypeptide n=1 Tax=Rhynchospora pubera TaxID=906938 RepID=A0AAV8FJF8_9POAL|nr:cytochrome P450 family 71 polypeptide [Rhynchospora pubera]
MASYYLLLPLFLLPLLLLLKSKSNSLKSNYKLPPGPWTLPVIGSLHHLISASLPHHALRTLSQRYGDLMFLQLGEQPTIVVSSSEAAREILKTHDLTFCARPVYSTVKIMYYGGNDIAFAPYGEHWRQVRKICILELLSSKQVQSFRSIREDEVGSFLRQISSMSSNGQIVNLSEGLLAITNNVLLRAIMGSKFKDQKPVLDDILKSFELTAGFNIVNLFPSSRIANLISGTVRKAEECHRSFDRLLDNLIRDHKEKGVDGEVEDLLAVLLRLHDEDQALSMDTVKAIVFDLIVAGTDTSSATVDWAMAELMKTPEVMKKAQTEVRQQFQGHENITESDLAYLNFMHPIIKETLRLHPPGPVNPRLCQETCKIMGYDIPKGTNVLLNTWTIGRDSKYWKDADEFKPERFSNSSSDMNFNGTNFEFIPFGSGRRICPGLSFAVAIVELTLANLLYHFNWELPSGMTPDQIDMTETFGLTTRRKSPLLLCAQPYHVFS